LGERARVRGHPNTLSTLWGERARVRGHPNTLSTLWGERARVRGERNRQGFKGEFSG